MTMLWMMNSLEMNVSITPSAKQCASKGNKINVSNNPSLTTHFPSSSKELFISIKVDYGG
jgi:hypothetical protein